VCASVTLPAVKTVSIGIFATVYVKVVFLAEFVFELKMDGWRCMTYIEDRSCRLSGIEE